MYTFPYDSFDALHKSPFGAVRTGVQITFSISLSDSILPTRCELLLYKADEFDAPARYEMTINRAHVGYNRYGCTILPEPVGQLYFYCFEVTAGGERRQIRRVDSHYGDFDENGALWQLTVYDRDFHAPQLYSRGIIYQIFPDRFYNSGVPKDNVPKDRTLHQNWNDMPEYLPNQNGEITNSDYFGGDLRGIAEQLDYLQDLGVSLIYLNPIFEAHSNHRYNVANYFKVDPLLGTNEDFQLLCRQARARGIGIVLDGVFSHTGSDSVYFNKAGRYGEGGAYRDPKSPYRDWYKFTEYPQKYHSWWGFETLPEIIEENEDYLEFICGEHGVIRYWMSLGAQGFRLDVADELPDVILDRLRQAVKAANPEGILIGEVWEDASNKISYSQRRHYLLGSQLDSVMNYPFMNAILRYVRYGDSNTLYHGILTILENYPAPAVQMLFSSLSTHDTPRAITQLAGEEYKGGDRSWQAQHYLLPPEMYRRGCSLLLIAYTILYFLPGNPCLYYGDEMGVCGWRDPFNRTTYPWNSGDEALRERFRLLGSLYRENAFLAEANFLPVSCTGEVFVFTRDAQSRALTVAVNRSDAPQDVSLVTEQGEQTVITGSYENGVLGPLSAVVIVE